jgi:hypothetical protein
MTNHLTCPSLQTHHLFFQLTPLASRSCVLCLELSCPVFYLFYQHMACLHSLRAFDEKCGSLLVRVDTSLELLKTMEASSLSIQGYTNSLKETCETLVEEQKVLFSILSFLLCYLVLSCLSFACPHLVFCVLSCQLSLSCLLSFVLPCLVFCIVLSLALSCLLSWNGFLVCLVLSFVLSCLVLPFYVVLSYALCCLLL